MMVMMRSMSRATNDKSAMRIIMRKLVALAEKKKLYLPREDNDE